MSDSRPNPPKRRTQRSRAQRSSANRAPARARADQLALRLFEQLRDRPLADRRFVLRALLGRLAAFGSDARVDVVVRALVACCDAHGGRAVSRREFDAWRASQPAPRELASSSLARATFGSWTKALLAVGYGAAGDARARGLKAHARWERGELLAALRAFAPADGRPLTTAAYMAAARAHNDALRPGQRRLPLTIGSFVRRFGSWARALTAAGLPASEMAEVYRDHARADSGPSSGRRRGRAVLGARADYRPERIVEVLREAAQALGTNYLTLSAYQGWARRTADEALADGRVLVLPRSKSIAARFGSWPAALFAAGLITEEERERHGRGGFAYTDEDLLAGLRTALEHFQGPPSRTAYDFWRRQRLEGDPLPKGLGLAGFNVVERRFGWSAAFTRAAGDDPRLRALAARPTVPHLPKGGRWGRAA